MKTVEAIIFSDAHASESDLRAIDALLRFLRDVCPSARRVFILGDLFDFWFGPAQVRRKPYVRVLEALAALAASGTQVTFYHGNRDFYLDSEIAHRYGFSLVRDYSIEIILGRRVLLCHGDALCVNDASYHRMRAFLRHPVVEKVIRAFPAFLARAMARLYRAHSKRVVPAKSQSVLGPDEKAVREHFALGADMIVCGHTHKEGVSTYQTPQGPGLLYNLGDFGETGSYLECSRDGWQFRSCSAL